MAFAYKGEIGKIFRAAFFRLIDGEQVPLDISAASVKEFRVQKPNGVFVELPLVFVTDGTDGLGDWVTAASTDLNVVGEWEFQGHAVGAGFEYFADVQTVFVRSVNPEP